MDIPVLKGRNVIECNEKGSSANQAYQLNIFFSPIQRSKYLMKRRASCLRPSHLWFSRTNGTGRKLLSTILYQDDGGKEPRYQLCLNSHAIPIGLPGPLKQGHLGPFLPKASKMLGYGSIRLSNSLSGWYVACSLLSTVLFGDVGSTPQMTKSFDTWPQPYNKYRLACVRFVFWVLRLPSCSTAWATHPKTISRVKTHVQIKDCKQLWTIIRH